MGGYGRPTGSSAGTGPCPPSITSFSAAPLRIATWLGLVSFLTRIGLVVSGLIAYANKVTVPGWTSLFVALLLLGAVQLICLGLLGGYVGRVYAARRPTSRGWSR